MCSRTGIYKKENGIHFAEIGWKEHLNRKSFRRASVNIAAWDLKAICHLSRVKRAAKCSPM